MSNDNKAAASKREKMIEALGSERANHLLAGNKDRAAQVDASIKALRGEKPAGRRAPEAPTAAARSEA